MQSFCARAAGAVRVPVPSEVTAVPRASLPTSVDALMVPVTLCAPCKYSPPPVSAELPWISAPTALNVPHPEHLLRRAPSLH